MSSDTAPAPAAPDSNAQGIAAPCVSLNAATLEIKPNGSESDPSNRSISREGEERSDSITRCDASNSGGAESGAHAASAATDDEVDRERGGSDVAPDAQPDDLVARKEDLEYQLRRDTTALIHARIVALTEQVTTWKQQSLDDCETLIEVQSERDALTERVAELERENDRLRRDRYEALSVTSRDGLLASEWVARTGRAEAEVQRLTQERDDWKRLAENWTACADAAQQPPEFYEKYNEGTMRAMQALLTRERCANAKLREVVAAAEEMLKLLVDQGRNGCGCLTCIAYYRKPFDAARAKLERT